MILKTFTQAQLNTPQTILTESNGKGLYCMRVITKATAGLNATGSVGILFNWTDAQNRPQALGTILDVPGNGVDSFSETFNIGAGIDLTVTIQDGGGVGGNFTVDVENYIVRQNTLGND